MNDHPDTSPELSWDDDCGKPLADTHNGCLAHSWEQWERIRKAQPWYRKLPQALELLWFHKLVHPYDHLIGRRLRELGRRVRLFRYGYDPREWFSHHYAVSALAIPHLTMMRDHGHGVKYGPKAWPDVQGVAESEDDRQEWKACLDDMIFFHTVSSGKLIRRVTFTSTLSERLGKTTAELSADFHDLTPEEQRRYRRGKLYYGQYFDQLWD